MGTNISIIILKPVNIPVLMAKGQARETVISFF
jgi:hypothetical protein